MGELIRLTKASGIADTRPFLVPLRRVVAVQVPAGPVEPPGVYLVELEGRPGNFWTWDLDLADLAADVLRQPR